MTRTRTASDLKFLLNERAAILDALQCAERNRKLLELGISRDEARLAARRAQFDVMGNALVVHTRELAAIDLVLGTTCPGMDARSLGAVRGWSTPLRPRGALKALVFRLLQAAAPGSVPTLTLVGPAAAAFGWPLTTPEERLDATRTVRRVLQKARDSGLVTAVHGTAGGREGQWRWRNQAPSVAQFLTDALAHDEPNSNLLGGEVAGQRAGGNRG